jgi:1-phosphofructokinase
VVVMANDVMVFAPTPLLTVTLECPNTNGVELHLHAGGQGVWQARMVRSFGLRVTLCGCVGGEIGDVVAPLIAREGVKLKLVNRMDSNGWYVDDRRRGERRRLAEASGQPLGRHELDELYGLTLTEGLDASVSVLSGPPDPSVVPADVYRRLASDLGGQGRHVVADLSGEQMDAALRGGVQFAKLSQEEMIDQGQLTSTTDDAVISMLEEVRERGAESVLISRAGEPALCLLDGTVYRVRVPRLEEADHHGAGDSMTAGVAATLARGGSLTEAVRTGAAAGALNVTRHGLGTGNVDTIAKFAKRVELSAVRRAGS